MKLKIVMLFFLEKTEPKKIMKLLTCRNYLKNRELSQKGPQNLHSEREFTAQEQVASESANFELGCGINPMPPKACFLGNFGIFAVQCLLFFSVSFVLADNISSEVELNILYQKNRQSPQTPYEISLVEHVQTSYENALKLQSKLTSKQFRDAPISTKTKDRDYSILKDLSSIPYYHLLNNLCELKGAAHLHVGLLAGDSLIAALYGNQSNLSLQIGVDWFQECPESIFFSNCQKHVDLSQCLIMDKGCFDVDKSIFTSPIDIYLYDADHSLLGHERAITYYNDIFADVFVIVIDDWECPWIRKPTFKAFDKLGYRILYEARIPGPCQYRSGQYVAVIKKQDHML